MTHEEALKIYKQASNLCQLAWQAHQQALDMGIESGPFKRALDLADEAQAKAIANVEAVAFKEDK